VSWYYFLQIKLRKTVKYNEILYVQENEKEEQWTGVRLGVSGAKNDLGSTTLSMVRIF
jgi:hypothetical protein